MAYKSSAKYTATKNATIQQNVMAAIQELAHYNGVDIQTIKDTTPYSIALQGVTTQKIASTIKKMIDIGVLVKGSRPNHTMKYMMRSRYEQLLKDGYTPEEKYGYLDYRDRPEYKVAQEELRQEREESEELSEEEFNELAKQLRMMKKPKHKPEW